MIYAQASVCNGTMSGEDKQKFNGVCATSVVAMQSALKALGFLVDHLDNKAVERDLKLYDTTILMLVQAGAEDRIPRVWRIDLQNKA